MTPTPEILELIIGAIRAQAAGKPWQQRCPGHENHSLREWHPGTGAIAGFENGYWEYRPTPEPKRRAWNRPEDVLGPVCYVESAAFTGALLVTETTDDGVWMSNGQFSPFKELETYSTDRKTWAKCEVEEQS